MRLGIMQPYFFPYLGYYSLIKYTDKFILFDTVQFIRHGWIERNRILKPVEGWQYIAVPLDKKSMTTNIKDVSIKNTEDWKSRIIRQLEHYKKRAPYYTQTINLVEECLAISTDSIVQLNAYILNKTCQALEIPLDLSIFSELNLSVGQVSHPGEWALYISKALGAEEYINPTGGIEIFNKNQFQDSGIKLSFLGNKLEHYSQRRGNFEAGLSIIDVMMFNDLEAIHKQIDNTYYLDV